MNAQTAYANGLIPNGHYAICDCFGRLIRIDRIITNGMGQIYRATSAGLVRVYF